MIKVLIVEDSKAIRDKIKQHLSESQNIEIVGEAANVKDAVRIGKEKKPHVMILDIKLEGDKTGFEVLTELKAIHPALKTIVLTNYPENQYKRKAVEMGADYYFDKSHEFDKAIKLFSRA